MRRICTEEENLLLAKCKEEILTDIFRLKHGNGPAPLLLGLLLGCLVGAVICVPIAQKCYEAGIKVNGVVVSVVVILFLNFLVMIMTAVSGAVLKKLGVSGDKGGFFRDKQLEINGATVVEVAIREGYFSFVEDDFVERFTGKLYAIDFPLKGANAYKLKPGERILAVRNAKGAYVLMRLNEKTAHLVARSNPELERETDLSELPHIPHPNAEFLEKEPRQLYAKEKEVFLKQYRKQKSTAKRVLIVTFSILLWLLLFVFFCVMVADDSITVETIGIGLICFVIFGIMMEVVLVLLVRSMGMRKAKTVTHRKEVLFNYSTMDSNAQTETWVFEQNHGALQAKMYSNTRLSGKIPYGTVLYKYYGEKHECFVVKEDKYN